MTEEPNSRFSRPLRAERNVGERRPPLPRPKSSRMGRNEAEAFIRDNAERMTASDMALATGITTQHVRNVCRALRIAPMLDPVTKAPQGNAHDDFEPALCIDRELRLDAPPGTLARIEKLRARAEKGVELWDANDDARGLPQCRAKIERAKTENVL